ncbi:MAG: DUF2071 domain-containing protein [Bacteroidia bacterium]
MHFLQAEWRKLILANYACDPQVLLPYLPRHTELDTWQGTHYVSLVGFLFDRTRMLGLRIPFHTRFEEVNLRFYVRRQVAGEWRRGVVFVREIVPRRALSLVANTIYREHYVTRPMRHAWTSDDQQQTVAYHWREQGLWQQLAVMTDKDAHPIDPASETGFITEHYWGYTRIDAQQTFEYEVRHPTWDAYPVRSYDIDVDFGRVYGPVFASLGDQTPLSVMLAEGSPITVEHTRRLR